MNRTLSTIVMLGVLLGTTNTAAFARGSDWTITTGPGKEEVTVKNGWFGKKTRVAKDRFGNKIEKKTGILGNGSSEVSVLGNSYRKEKGILGGSEVEAKTLLGDSIKTEKGIFGRRKTTIDASGITGVVGAFISSKMNTKPNPPLLDPSAFSNNNGLPGGGGVDPMGGDDQLGQYGPGTDLGQTQ